MLAGLAVAVLGLLVAATCAAVPSVVQRASVSWPDANWPGELGSVPLGNGDVAGNVWIDQATGTLYIYAAKSDAYDANNNPVKVARLAVLFSPTLWVQGQTTDFNQTLDVATGSFSVTTASYSVLVFIDANSDTLYITANSTNGQAFNMSATLEVYRTSTVVTNLGGGTYCSNLYDTADTVLPSPPGSLSDAVVWYHRNEYVNGTSGSYMYTTLEQQGVDPTAIPDPFINNTFGGAMYGSPNLIKNSSISLSGVNVTAAVVTVVLLTEQVADEQTWIDDIEALVTQSTQTSVETAWSSHVATWDMLWGRSYIDISTTNASAFAQQNVELVNTHYVWQRFLDLCNGRNAKLPIHFNGQAFVVNEGNGPDYRAWGPSFW